MLTCVLGPLPDADRRPTMREGGDLLEADAFGADFDLAQATGEPAFTVDLDGFERPLDLLLGACPAARKLRLELAADYLVMAAWLAFLKSRLLSGTFERSTEGERPLHCNCCSGLPLESAASRFRATET